MTLDEIAKTMGVSKSTVSRALSGKGRIGKETKEKIEKFVHQQSMMDSGAGRASATQNLGVILPDDVYSKGGPYFQECILGICETAAFLDYDVLIATGTAKDFTSIRTLVEKSKVDGIILLRSMEEDRTLHYLTDIGFPVGLTGTCASDDVIQVDIDNEAAAESMISLLVGNGYTRFTIFLDDMEYAVNKTRYRGICNGLRNKGLSVEKQRLITSPLRVDLIDSILEEMLVQQTECIICGDDIICTKIMSALQLAGYRIPRDIAVASLYNSSNLDCFSPSVTAVNVSARQVGNMVCKQMIYCLEGRPYQKKTTIDYEILMRKSAGGRQI